MYAVPVQARFSISLVAPKDRTVHSNMPEESDSKEGGGDADLAVMAKVLQSGFLFLSPTII